MFTLRPYQQDLEDRVRAAFFHSRRVLLVSPTGSGKTVIFSDIAAKVRRKNKRIGIFVHRVELIEQVSNALRECDVPHGVIAAGRPMVQSAVHVVGVQTYTRRLSAVPEFDLCIVDEAHHAVEGSTWGKALGRSPKAHVLGVTATPLRLDGRGLASHFDHMIEGPTVADLIASGSLAPYRLFAPAVPDMSEVHTRGGDFRQDESVGLIDRPTITGDAVAHYQRLAPGKRAIVFCCSVQHAKHVADTFRAAGVVACAIDGTLDRAVRRDVIRGFVRGTVQVLTSCDLVSEGFDLPAIEVAILLRPTQSLALHLQQVGRSLRPSPGKSHALILDHVGNWMRHGLPDDPREWTLEGAEKGKDREKPEFANRQCPKCYAVMRVGRSSCPECGHVMAPMPRTVDQRDGELTEVDVAAERRRLSDEQRERARTQGMAKALDELVAVGVARARKKAETEGRAFTREDAARAERWAKHVMNAREAKRLAAESKRREAA